MHLLIGSLLQQTAEYLDHKKTEFSDKAQAAGEEAVDEVVEETEQVAAEEEIADDEQTLEELARKAEAFIKQEEEALARKNKQV
ncbi:hypothetical protein BZG36_01078 [Bifiguratus adelaidae]|uniref:Uncharacterized protein n=1 Tax=Bifiguratus adelaidae TaxID=1938954 RepID=A0A261Y612_9FUNG|nr:hypothetical protein BZG36_01078 [Bifiguratus adelaidae]